jgi:AcrR family transcriptional regulator
LGYQATRSYQAKDYQLGKQMRAHTNSGRMASQRGDSSVSSASGKRLRAQGQRTCELIVQEARNVLLEGGTLEFSLRTVARRAHISISNLQYYFPTRASLLRAIVEPIVSRYVAKIGSGVGDKRSARETLAAVINQNLGDVRDPEISAIWLHFASLALTDPDGARVLDMAHAALVSDLGRLICTVNPSLGSKDSQALARLIIAMVDGLVFQIGAGHRFPRSAAGIEARLREIITLLIEEYGGSARKSAE